MADVFTKERRSAVMSRIRGRGNKTTELTLARLLRSARITGWRRHAAVFGRPDFSFPAKRVAVFVDGCFWHGCPRCYQKPGNNGEFWANKLNRNRERDKVVTATLRAQGWSVIRVWEHELEKPNSFIRRLEKLLARTALPRRAVGSNGAAKR